MEPAWIIAIIVIAAFVLLIVWGIGLYNQLVRKRIATDDAWATIDVQLKRRHDLIPNLVQTVKGYAAHEQQTLQQVVEARRQAVAATGPAEQAQAENLLTGMLRQLFALSEAYPDLKANQNFLQLQQELAETENRISQSRTAYNDTVRRYNTAVQQVPTNIIAGMFNFQPRDFFEIEDPAARQTPQVRF